MTSPFVVARVADQRIIVELVSVMLPSDPTGFQYVPSPTTKEIDVPAGVRDLAWSERQFRNVASSAPGIVNTPEATVPDCIERCRVATAIAAKFGEALAFVVVRSTRA